MYNLMYVAAPSTVCTYVSDDQLVLIHVFIYPLKD